MADQILFTDGRLYQCVTAANAGESPTSAPAKWLEIQIPKEWRRVLAQLTYEHLLKITGQTDKAQSEEPAGKILLDDQVRLEANRENWRNRPCVR